MQARSCRIGRVLGCKAGVCSRQASPLYTICDHERIGHHSDSVQGLTLSQLKPSQGLLYSHSSRLIACVLTAHVCTISWRQWASALLLAVFQRRLLVVD